MSKGWQQAIGGAIDAGGVIYQAAEQRRAARNQRDWEQEMSSTAYQRAMSDMKAAGLNPLLAAKLGPASTPSGATANVPNMGSIGSQAVSSAIGVKNAIQDVKAKKLQNEEAENQMKILRQAMEYYNKNPDKQHALQEAALSRLVGIRPELGLVGGLIRQGVEGGKNLGENILEKGAWTAQQVKKLSEELLDLGRKTSQKLYYKNRPLMLNGQVITAPQKRKGTKE